MKTTKPKLSARKAVALATDNGKSPMHKDQLYRKLFEMLGGDVPQTLFKSAKAMGLKNHGGGVFSATILIKEFETIRAREGFATEAGADAPPAGVLNGNPTVSGQAEAQTAQHSTGELTCPACGKVAKSPAGLTIHRHRMHGVVAKRKKKLKLALARMRRDMPPMDADAATVRVVQPQGQEAEVIRIVRDFSDLMTAYRLVMNKRAAMSGQ